MIGSIKIFGIFIVFIAILSTEISYMEFIHNRAMIQRSLMRSLEYSYFATNEKEAQEMFESEFYYLIPTHLDYEVICLNYEVEPKLVHFKVIGSNGNGQSIMVEKALIEEEISEIKT